MTRKLTPEVIKKQSNKSGLQEMFDKLMVKRNPDVIGQYNFDWWSNETDKGKLQYIEDLLNNSWICVSGTSPVGYPTTIAPVEGGTYGATVRTDIYMESFTVAMHVFREYLSVSQRDGIFTIG